MKRRETLLLVLLSLALVTWIACSSRDSPTAPSPPAADFAAQFDSLWSTFDREYSYFRHKQIDWNALRTTFRPRAIAATDQMRVHRRHPRDARTPSRYARRLARSRRRSHRHLRSPGLRQLGSIRVAAVHRRANWTQGQTDWGYGVLESVPYIAIGGWNAASIRAADFDAALERFRNAPMLILDVRMNGGGDDQIAFEIAGRFAQTSVTTGYVRFRMRPVAQPTSDRRFHAS